MSFDDLWKQVNGLPDMALLEVPSALSSVSKKKLTKKSPTDISKIVSEAIDEINQGSVETLDSLIRKRL